jgi:hypothetical protein
VEDSRVTKEVSGEPIAPAIEFQWQSWLTGGVAFRDRNAGSAANRGKPTDEAEQGRRTRGTYEGRGRGRPFDRHSRTVGG